MNGLGTELSLWGHPQRIQGILMLWHFVIWTWGYSSWLIKESIKLAANWEGGRGGEKEYIPFRGLGFKMRHRDGRRPVDLWRESGIVVIINIIMSYFVQCKKAVILRCTSISEKLKNKNMCTLESWPAMYSVLSSHVNFLMTLKSKFSCSHLTGEKTGAQRG